MSRTSVEPMRHRRWELFFGSIAVAAVVATSWAPRDAQAYRSPSFSCEGKLTVTEKVICEFISLKGMDGLLAVNYQLLRSYLSDEEGEQFVREQRSWLKNRDAECLSDRDVAAIDTEAERRQIQDCLDKLYLERLKELGKRIVDAAARRLKQAGPGERFAPDFWGAHLPVPPMETDERVVEDDLPYSWHDLAVTKDGALLVAYVYTTTIGDEKRRHFNVYSSKSNALVFHKMIRAGTPERVGPEFFNSIWDNAALVYGYPQRYGEVAVGDGRTVRAGRSGTSHCGHSYDGFIEIEAADGTIEQSTSLIVHRPESVRAPITLCSEQLGSDDVEVVDGWFNIWGSSDFTYTLDLADGSYLLLSKQLGTMIRCTGSLACPWATPANGVYLAPFDTIDRLTKETILTAPDSSHVVERVDEAVQRFLEQATEEP
jgi:uncharacterized protein